MDCGIVVNEFEFQSRYYVHFRRKYPWERYEPPYPPSYGLDSTTTVLLGRLALALNNLQRVDMPLNKETKPNQRLDKKTGRTGKKKKNWDLVDYSIVEIG